MAGDWIKIEHWTPDKPEVFRMSEILNIDPDAVSGKLLRIWIWADQQTVTGDAHSVTFASLDRLASVTGFAQAMIKCGWLEQTEDGLRFVNFERHNGETAEKRAETAKRNSALRSRRHERDKKVTQTASHLRHESVTSASPKEEKRREESNKKPPTPLPGEDGTDSETGADFEFTAPSPFTLDRSQPAPFGLDHDDFDRTDWTRIESAFVDRWNSTPGVVATRQRSIPDRLAREFQRRACEPGWLFAAEQALAKFPLKCLTGGMRMATFFDPETVNAILAGNYDFDPATRGPRKQNGEEKDKELGVIEAEQAKHRERVKTDKANAQIAKEKAERLRAKWLAQASILGPEDIAELAAKHPELKLPDWQERAARPTGHPVQRRAFQRGLENAICEALELERGLSPAEADLVDFDDAAKRYTFTG